MKLYLTSIITLLLISSTAMAQDTLYIYKSGARVNKKAVAEIDTILFEGANQDSLSIYASGVNVVKRAVADIDSIIFYKASTTPEDATADLAAIYNVLKKDDWCSSFLLSEIASDECAGGAGTSDSPFYISLDRSLQQSDPSAFITPWNAYYGGILLANTYLINEYKIDWTGHEAQRTQYQAETRFLRAYMHFYLARMFGEIPWIDHVFSLDDMPSATPAKELYSSIVDDLKFCADSGLTVSYPGYNADWGRATKWAAEALIGRVYLFYSGFYNDPELNNLTGSDARAYIDDVIQNGGFSLVSEYASLWRVPAYSELGGGTSIDGYAGEINTEVVWSVRLDPATRDSYYQQFMRMIGPRGTNIDPYGQGWGAMPVLPSLWNEYDTADTRRTATILSWDDEGLTYDWVSNGQAQYTGYNSKKYEIASVGGAPETQPDWQADNFEDYMVIRYADVLLMGAEFHLTDGDMPTALSYINMVRTRAFGDGSHNYVTLTMDDIAAERKLELACEGIRYWDILRSCKGDFSKLASILTNIDDADGGDYSQTTDTQSKDVDGNNFIATEGLFPQP
jgi:starch-binding outer membrane protein, SusD/RagB family